MKKQKKYERVIDNNMDYLEELQKAMAKEFGSLDGRFHLIPKSIWIHPFADYIATFPPNQDRQTWLYATFALSILSHKAIELIIERPKEDTDYGLGNLARLMEYFLENSEFELWHSMGPGDVFGEDSLLKGFLFCPPPKFISAKIFVKGKTIDLIYIAGISEKDLLEAQKQDDALGEFRGAKALYKRIGIENNGISYLEKLSSC